MMLESAFLLYPLNHWLKIEEKIMKLPSLDNSSRKLQRLLVGHAVEIDIDSSARILIPLELREFSKINKEAMFIGQGKRFEIWDYLTWTKSREKWLEKETLTLPKDFEMLSL